MKRIRLTPILIHVYMFMTVVATVFLFQDIRDPLFKLGASSWLIGLLGGSIEISNGFVYVLLFLWGILSPVLLIIFYVMACKKKYIPFTVVAMIDAAVVLFWTIGRFAAKDMYAFDSWITDAIVSTLFSAILITSLCIEKRAREPVTEDDECETTDSSLSSLMLLKTDLNQP